MLGIYTTSDLLHRGIDESETGVPVPVQQAVWVLQIWPRLIGPQPEQGHLARATGNLGHGNRLERFHAQDEITLLQFKIADGRCTVLRQVDRSPCGKPHGTPVRGSTSISAESGRDGSESQLRGTSLRIGTSADVAAANEDEALHVVPADLAICAVRAQPIEELARHELQQADLAAVSFTYHA